MDDAYTDVRLGWYKWAQCKISPKLHFSMYATNFDINGYLNRLKILITISG